MKNSHPNDGVIRYQLEFTPAPSINPSESAELRAWFRICRQTLLLGQYPDLYDGVAYGNLSKRLDDANFLITGTQVSGLQELAPNHFAVVQDFDPEQNKLVASGSWEPSSEAMTHGMVYRLLPKVKAVFHAHSKVIWENAQQLRLPITHPDAEYGTPEMTEEVTRLLQAPEMAQSGVFSMGGHEDGIVAYADSPQQAGSLLLTTLAKALETESC